MRSAERAEPVVEGGQNENDGHRRGSQPEKAGKRPLDPGVSRSDHDREMTMFGPGSDWHSDRVSVKSSSVIQPLRSTSIRRANGSTPPNPDNPTPRKARNMARASGGD